MLKIRLQRRGKRHQPFYRIVVAEHTTAAKGRPREDLGTYDPASKIMVVKEDRVAYYLAVGAKPSATVEALLRKHSKILG